MPAISGISAAKNADGTSTVTITGSGYVRGDTVTVDGINCTPVNIISTTQLTCTLPSNDIPLIDVVVTSPIQNGGGSSAPTTLKTYVLFITSASYQGNLGGLSGADSLCLSVANAGTKTKDLTGTWRALLSTSQYGANVRIHLKATSVQIKDSIGNVLFSDKSKLWSAPPTVRVSADENGLSNTSSTLSAWTGSTSAGLTNSEDCSSWTSSSSFVPGYYGVPNAAQANLWFSTYHLACDQQLHLYCINADD